LAFKAVVILFGGVGSNTHYLLLLFKIRRRPNIRHIFRGLSLKPYTDSGNLPPDDFGQRYCPKRRNFHFQRRATTCEAAAASL